MLKNNSLVSIMYSHKQYKVYGKYKKSLTKCKMLVFYIFFSTMVILNHRLYDQRT